MGLRFAIRKLIHRKDLDWKIKNGVAQRGRTDHIPVKTMAEITQKVKSGQPVTFPDGINPPPQPNPPIQGGNMVWESTLLAEHVRNGKLIGRRVVQGRVVTLAFVNDLVDAMIGTAGPYGTIKTYKYHGTGISTAAESTADVALGTPCGTIVRATGTQSTASLSRVYQSIATVTFDNTYAVTEHGLFNNASGSVLMDRSVFSAINVINTDSIVFTYQLTNNAGG